MLTGNPLFCGISQVQAIKAGRHDEVRARLVAIENAKTRKAA
jgi:hypothetical protein